MKSAKSLLVAALAAVVAVLAVIAWRQQAEISRLRAELALATDTLQKRAVTAEARSESVQKELTARRSLSNATDGAAKGDMPPNGRRSFANMAEMMNRPEVQKAMALRTRAMLDATYATLFKKLKLSPEKLEQLKQLMVERQQVGSDVFAAAAQQGIDPMQNGRELAKLTAEGQAKVDSEIKAALGDEAFGEYQNYQATLPQRNLVNQLAQSLSYTSAPLTETQSDQLVQILADNQPPRPANAGANPNVMVARSSVGGPGGPPDAVAFVGPAPGSATITDAAVNASRSVLSEAQVSALQQLQDQQAQLRALGPGGRVGPGTATVIQTTTTDAPIVGAKPGQ